MTFDEKVVKYLEDNEPDILKYVSENIIESMTGRDDKDWYAIHVDFRKLLAERNIEIAEDEEPIGGAIYKEKEDDLILGTKFSNPENEEDVVVITATINMAAKMMQSAFLHLKSSEMAKSIIDGETSDVAKQSIH